MSKRLWEKGGALDANMHRFTVGNDPEIDRTLVVWDALASAAHAKMLGRIGILSAEETKQLVLALSEITKKAGAGEFEIPDELEDCHTAIEAALVEQLGEVGKKIHTGRSRNDQVLVAMRLYLRHEVSCLLQQLNSLNSKFLSRAESDGENPMPGYTHMQRAMPSSVGMWLQAFSECTLGLTRQGLSLLDALDCNPLGAASGFGVPLYLDRAYTSELLGFQRVERNPIHVQNNRGRHELNALRWCVDIGSMIEKFASDLILYSTAEFGFFSLPKSLTTGSSIMPQKHNPDVLELLRARTGKLRGAESELAWLIAKLPSNYHRDFQYTKEPVIKSIESLGEMLSMLEVIVDEFQIDPGKLKSAMSEELFATYGVYKKVRGGISFRDAYREVAERIAAGNLDYSALAEDFSYIQEILDSELEEAKTELQELEKAVKSGMRRTNLAYEELLRVESTSAK